MRDERRRQRGMNRRGFVKSVGGAAAAGALGLGLLAPRRAHAAWADIPAGLLPPTMTSCKVLEIFLLGGLSPWETFYHQPDIPDPWRDFESDFAALSWCAGGPSPATFTQAFANDEEGAAVDLGPATKPLWRSDLLDRLRVVTLRHDLLVHELAVPYAMTGRRLGRPNLAGLGTPIHRRAQELQPTVAVPRAFTCEAAALNFPADIVAPMKAVGSHPGSARPVSLKIGPGSSVLVGQLARANRGGTADALQQQYRAQYRDRTRWPGTGDPTPSAGFAAYNASLDTVLDASTLQGILASAPLTPTALVSCPALTTAMDVTGASIRAAAHLLTRSPAARYVCVLDSGLVTANAGAAYDTHYADHAIHTSVNLFATLTALADVIQDPTQPADPDKIDLDDTLIVLNTEFGRRDKVGTGREHWPYGYAVGLLGGPITTRKVIGAIDASGGAVPDKVHNAADFQAAVLLAAGVNPLAPDNFALGELTAKVRVTGSDNQTITRLHQLFFA